ncbi:CopD family protein [Streptacidiphilus rugosus]|uniref:CopD family protein n=1 Tax=Streptacidiphilus rugosus TaxID=405783 RepID=UPI00055A0A06|nr:CopD family protein [Streptacidiphilus rugosus]
MSLPASLLAAAGYSPPPLWRVLTKSGYFLGLCGAIGATLTYAAAVRPALRSGVGDAADVDTLRRRAARFLAWSGVVLLVAGYFQLAARVARAGKGMPFGSALAPARIADYLNAPAKHGAWVAQGTITLVQNLVLVATAAVLISLFAPRAGRRVDTLALIALPLSVATTLVGAVPTKAFADLDDLLDTLLVQVHIVSGTVWVGGLALLAALATAGRRLGDGAGVLWADLWRRFGLVALICVGAVTISGLWLTWKSVGSVPQLWTTTYGVFLLVKITLVLGMITAGGFNQFWLMPRIARARRADATSTLLHLTLRHFPRVVWVEVALGAAVLGVLPFLSGSARSEAAPDSPAPTATGGILALGLVLVLTLAASLVATAKVSDTLARREPGLATA